ncbi:HD domain-containing phosphohydrolase [Exilibacterium tricleocarpae]|uniref:HD domain-containing phosphohydrolase n=1 Tax=Exilibacterium tricleocarpae TaxID=2591008 RepID=UPI0015D2E9D5|nr:HD domain-containing phosphohydrolase [Exilibacterium tricleocarpae]
MESKTKPKKPLLLFVDDEKPILDALTRFCRSRGWNTLKAPGGAEGLALLDEHKVDVIVSDMRMPQMNGAEFLTQARAKQPSAIRILLTGYADIDAVAEAVNAAKVYNYMHKPWDDNVLGELLENAIRAKKQEDERLRLQLLTRHQNKKLKELNDNLDLKVKERTIETEQAISLLTATHKQLEQNFQDSLEILAHIIEWREGKHSNHSRLVAKIAVSIGKQMELSSDNITDLHTAGLLHDIGMLSLPDQVRQKAVDELTDKELALYKKHCIIGEAALANAPGLQSASRLIRWHHERVDGKGFPNGLSGDMLPMGARILAVVSDFHDLENGRLVKSIAGSEPALRYLQEQSGKRYDAQVVEVLLAMLKNQPQTHHQVVLNVTASELQAEMTLSEDLISEAGLLLLAKGTELTDKTIAKLRQFEVDSESKLSFSVIAPEQSEQQSEAEQLDTTAT